MTNLDDRGNDFIVSSLLWEIGIFLVTLYLGQNHVNNLDILLKFNPLKHAVLFAIFHVIVSLDKNGVAL